MENEKKPFMLVQCPIGTQSGYGERSRDLVRALIALDKYDIKIISTRWGNTPMNALTDQDEDILSRLLMEQLQTQPDIFVQVTVPNEFQRVGKFNIGVTAGIETNLCDASWIEGCNKMDLILASSNHAKQVFESSIYEKRDSRTQQIVGQLKLEKPVEVLFEGVRTEVFNKTYNSSEAVDNILQQVKSDLDAIYDMHSDSPKPSKRFEQLPVFKRFVVDPEARGQVTSYYDLKNSVDEATRTENLLQRSMRFEEYGQYMKDNIKMFAVKSYVLDLEKTLKQYNEMKVMIRASKMDADAKRDALLNINRAENQLTANIQQLKSKL